jgi:hypothetical protein
MGKIKAQTVAERFGFKDDQLATQGHDRIVRWTADHVLDILAEKGKVFPSAGDYWQDRDVNPSCRGAPVDKEHPPYPGPRVRPTWEPLVYNSKGFEVGFIDLKVIVEVPKLGYDAKRDAFTISYEPAKKTYWFEIKTKIPSLGELFRQLTMYRENLQGPIFVVCPDDKNQPLIEQQGYYFIKSPRVEKKNKESQKLCLKLPGME